MFDRASGRRKALGRGLWVCGVLAFAGPAYGATPAARAAAEALFDEARALLRDGRADAACPKLEESQRLDPGVGTLLHLGECYERLGRTASAWATFREAEAAAKAAAQEDRERLSRDRAAALEPRLSRLVLKVDGGPGVRGLEVLRDGERVGVASFGSAMPVDPGVHAVEARAVGHDTFRASVTIIDGATVTVLIPALAPTADVRPDRPARDASPPRPRVSPVVIGLGAGAALAAATGAYFGLSAREAWQRSRDRCDADNACDAVGVADTERAAARARASNVAWGVGVALGGAALVIHLGSRSDVSIVARPGSVAFAGVFR